MPMWAARAACWAAQILRTTGGDRHDGRRLPYASRPARSAPDGPGEGDDTPTPTITKLKFAELELRLEVGADGEINGELAFTDSLSMDMAGRVSGGVAVGGVAGDVHSHRQGPTRHLHR